MPILKLLFYPPPQDLYTHALFERLSLSPIMNNSPSYTTHPPIHIVFVFCVVFSCPLLVIVINSPPVRQVDCDRIDLALVRTQAYPPRPCFVQRVDYRCGLSTCCRLSPYRRRHRHIPSSDPIRPAPQPTHAPKSCAHTIHSSRYPLHLSLLSQVLQPM